MDSSTTTIEISFWTHILNDNWMHICLKKNLVHSFPTPKNYDMLNTKSSEHQTLIRCFRQASRHHKRTNRMPLDFNLSMTHSCFVLVSAQPRNDLRPRRRPHLWSKVVGRCFSSSPLGSTPMAANGDNINNSHDWFGDKYHHIQFQHIFQTSLVYHTTSHGNHGP